MANSYPKRAARTALAVSARDVDEYAQNSLTAKEQLYTQARALGSVPVVAARIAGFEDPDEAAERLESSQLVQRAVSAAGRAKMRERRVTREVVLDWMIDAMHNAATSTEQLAAAREIGKLLGFYEPAKLQISTTIEVRKAELMSKSDAELLALAGDSLEGNFRLIDFESAPLDEQ